MQTAYVVPHSLTPKKPHEILQELLVKEPYRDMWGQFLQRRRGTGINVRAVATFMAYELSEDEDHELSPDQLKDSVRRALRGELMTDRTANRFIVAFGFTEDESALLWQSFIHHRYLSHSALEQNRKAGKAGEYISLSQTFVLDIDKKGFLTSVEITEILMSEIEGLEYIKPHIEGSGLEFQVLKGGTLEKVQAASLDFVKNSEHNSYTVYFRTPYPLAKGEIHKTHYRIAVNERIDDFPHYTNLMGVGVSDKPKFNITIILRFEEGPPEIKHCVWDDLAEESPLQTDDLTPGLTHYSMHYPVIHQSYCGFLWPVMRPDGTKGAINMSRNPSTPDTND